MITDLDGRHGAVTIFAVLTVELYVRWRILGQMRMESRPMDVLETLSGFFRNLDRLEWARLVDVSLQASKAWITRLCHQRIIHDRHERCAALHANAHRELFEPSRRFLTLSLNFRLHAHAKDRNASLCAGADQSGRGRKREHERIRIVGDGRGMESDVTQCAHEMDFPIIHRAGNAARQKMQELRAVFTKRNGVLWFFQGSPPYVIFCPFPLFHAIRAGNTPIAKETRHVYTVCYPYTGEEC